MSSLQADTARFTLEIAGVAGVLHVVGFEGTEQLSQPYGFTLELAAEDPEIAFDQVINQPAHLTLYGRDEPRQVHAFVSRFEQGDQGDRYTSYYATLVPRIWYLNHRHNCRIFQNLDVQQIVEQVLQDAGFTGEDYRFALQQSYPVRTYCVQYRESELNFISRLLEEEGISYFFEHSENNHVLVMCDGASAYAPIPGIPRVIFHRATGAAPDEEHIYQYRYSEAVRPGTVTFRDYNFKKPALNLQSGAGAEWDPHLEVYDYPGNYDDPNLGQTRAQVRLEGLQSLRQLGRGEGDSVRFQPGFKFTLASHTREAFNQKYLLTRVKQVGRQPQVLGESASSEGSSYHNEFVCIPAEVPYRPPHQAKKPRVEGTQTAIVVGPAEEEIYTDEHGRVKVSFHWDRAGQADENSSCWIRISNGWAGAGWGAMYLPRIGQEVIVDFLEGDPDRPIITGRVYHGTNRPPYKLPDEKTKSTLKSNSSKGGDGFNEIRFEDKKGEEQIFVHGEKDQDIRIKNDRFEWIGHDRHLVVKNDKFEHVENNSHRLIDADCQTQIKGDDHLTVNGKQAITITESYSLTVGNNVIEIFKGNHNEETKESFFLKANGTIIEATTGITLKCGGSNVVIDPSGVTVKGSLVTVDGSAVKIASGPGSPAKSGVQRPAAKPAAPEIALDADIAEPGKVSKAKSAKAHELEEIPFKQASFNSPASSDEKAPMPATVEEEEETPPELEFSFSLSDTPGSAGHPLAHTPWMVAVGSKPVGMDLLPPEAVLAKGETDANGDIQFDAEQKKAINEAYKKRPGGLWLLSPTGSVRIEVTTESPDWSDEEKLQHALLAANFCSDIPRSGGEHAEELSRIAQDAFELSDANELYSKLPDK
jgi:type VI secretion system secreted protein VgrG